MSHHRLEIFNGLLENLNLVIDKLKQDRQDRPDREINLVDFWEEYERHVHTVSSECTKLCMAFSSAPHPSSSGCKMFRERVESAILVLVSTTYKLPKSSGKTLYNCVFDHTCNIVISVQELALVIGEHAKSVQKTALQCTGGVWELCDSVSKLPRDGKQMTLGILAETVSLVQDALSELEDSVRMTDSKENSYDEEDGDGETIEQNWSEEDKTICHGCIGLIKTTKSVLKKFQASLKKYKTGNDGVQKIEDLEVCICRSKEASPCIDDLVEALYPPLSAANVLCMSEALVGSSRLFLGEAPNMYFIGEEDMEWIQFLLKAVEHNWTKVQSLCVSI